MGRGRLEAFSDGVIAVIITVMVLELKAPEGSDWRSLGPLLPTFLIYVLSFVFVAIYWNNHHHMLHAVQRIDGRALWANLHLLFWLSLVPFVTSWMGASHFAKIPTALYGVVLLMSAVAFTILERVLVSLGENVALASAIKDDFKEKVSLACYVFAIGLAFVNPILSTALFIIVALMWLIPDRRIEKRIAR